VIPSTLHPADNVVEILKGVQVYNIYQVPLKALFHKKFIDLFMGEGYLTMCSPQQEDEHRDFFAINSKGEFFCDMDYKFLSKCMGLRTVRDLRTRATSKYTICFLIVWLL